MPSDDWSLPPGTTYPGSKRKVRDYSTQEDANAVVPDPGVNLGPEVRNAQQHAVMVDGEFTYTTGVLASQLNRQPKTIYDWLRKGLIPDTPYRMPGRTDPRGQRRLYTRAQITGLTKIAYEEGVLYDMRRKLSETRFTQRAFDLFEELDSE
jgi:hypothetical protein